MKLFVSFLTLIFSAFILALQFLPFNAPIENGIEVTEAVDRFFEKQ